MPSAVRLREDYSAEELRASARRSKSVNQSRRLLSLAAVRDGIDRGRAAKIGGMDRQTLRDWVHRFNAAGPEGLVDNWTEGPKPRLSADNWLSSRRSSRRVRIVRSTASCAGVGSISSPFQARGPGFKGPRHAGTAGLKGNLLPHSGSRLSSWREA